MMCTRACFNTNKAARQGREELQYLSAANALADYHRTINIHAVNLEYRLRNIETDRDNLAHGRLPSLWLRLAQPPLAQSMPQSGRRPQHQKRTRGSKPSMSANIIRRHLQ